MSGVQRPVVIGFFEDISKVKEVIGILRDVGFRDDQLRIVLSKDELERHRFVNDLISMGLAEEEAGYFEHELERGQSIVAVRHDGRHWEAVNILYDGRIQKYMRWVKSFKESEVPPVGNALLPIEPLEALSIREDSIPSWEKLLRDAGFGHLI